MVAMILAAVIVVIVQKDDSHIPKLCIHGQGFSIRTGMPEILFFSSQIKKGVNHHFVQFGM
jgi:hypothetical protein